MPPLDTDGLPCTFVEQGATVQQSPQPELEFGDASIGPSR